MCSLWLLCTLFTISTSRPPIVSREAVEIIVKSKYVLIEIGVRENGEDEEETRTGDKDVDVLKELEELEKELNEPGSGAEYDGKEVESFVDSYGDVADGLRLAPANLETQAEEEFLELTVIPKRQHVRYDKPAEDNKKQQHTTFYEIPGVIVAIRVTSAGEGSGEGYSV